MTSYEQGFLSKCASSGVPSNVAIGMLKRSAFKVPRWLNLASLLFPEAPAPVGAEGGPTDGTKNAVRAPTRVDEYRRKSLPWLNNGQDAPVSRSDLEHPFNVGRIAVGWPGPIPEGSASNLVHSVGSSILDSGLRPREHLVPSDRMFGGGYYSFADEDNGIAADQGTRIVNDILADADRRASAEGSR